VQETQDTSAFRAISHPTRRAILDTLAQGERSVTELTQQFAVSQPAISQHLDVLRRAGLVAVEPDGRQRRYRLDPAPLREVFDWATRYEAFWRGSLDRLGAVLDREARR
jgi:DNA-binding transcriptional ArsR family regulator